MRDVTAVQDASGVVSASRRRMPDWVRGHRAMAVVADTACAALAGALALLVRFGEVTAYVFPYVVSSAALPAVWVCVVALNRAYEPRLIGLGSEEFQRILQCGFMLTAALAVGAYLTKTDVARGYVVLALPLTTLLTLLARYGLRRSCTAGGPGADACGGWWRWVTGWRSPSWSAGSAGSATTAWRSSGPAPRTTG